MLRKITAAAAVAATVALGAPVAHADAPVRTCRMVAYDNGTGTFNGFAVGYVAHSEIGSPVSIYCYVNVNGFTWSTTGTGTGNGFATTAGPVTFPASDTDTVEICTVITSSHGTVDECFPTTTSGIPPVEILSAVCDVTAILAPLNVHDVVEITAPDGSVYVLGAPVLICPFTGDSPVNVIVG